MPEISGSGEAPFEAVVHVAETVSRTMSGACAVSKKGNILRGRDEPVSMIISESVLGGGCPRAFPGSTPRNPS